MDEVETYTHLLDFSGQTPEQEAGPPNRRLDPRAGGQTPSRRPDPEQEAGPPNRRLDPRAGGRTPGQEASVDPTPTRLFAPTSLCRLLIPRSLHRLPFVFSNTLAAGR